MDRSTRRELIERLNRHGRILAGHFGLAYRSIEAERASVKRRYGVCFSDGTIRIRLGHARTGQPLRYSSLVDTLCHELAHLRHFDHGPRFQRLYWALLQFARQAGIYQPGARNGKIAPPTPAPQPASQGPQQLWLLGEEWLPTPRRRAGRRR